MGLGEREAVGGEEGEAEKEALALAPLLPLLALLALAQPEALGGWPVGDTVRVPLAEKLGDTLLEALPSRAGEGVRVAPAEAEGVPLAPVALPLPPLLPEGERLGLAVPAAGLALPPSAPGVPLAHTVGATVGLSVAEVVGVGPPTPATTEGLPVPLRSTEAVGE